MSETKLFNAMDGKERHLKSYLVTGFLSFQISKFCKLTAVSQVHSEKGDSKFRESTTEIVSK